MLFNLTLPTVISRIVTLLVAFTCHEFAHAAVADRLGDPTPRDAGRLTLNPFVHLDLIGTLFLLLVGFGWAKPVPVNPYYVERKNKAGMMWVSLAGPVTNFLLAVVAALPIRFGWVPLFSGTSQYFPSLGEFLVEFLFINLSLFLFNLLPIAPLDGEKVLAYFLPGPWADAMDRIRPYSPIILIVIIWVLPRFGVDLINILIQRPVLNMAYFLIGR